MGKHQPVYFLVPGAYRNVFVVTYNMMPKTPTVTAMCNIMTFRSNPNQLAPITSRIFSPAFFSLAIFSPGGRFTRALFPAYSLAITT